MLLIAHDKDSRGQHSAFKLILYMRVCYLVPLHQPPRRIDSSGPASAATDLVFIFYLPHGAMCAYVNNYTYFQNSGLR